MREQEAPQSLSQGDTPYLPPRGPGEPCCLWGASGPGSGPLAPPSQPHSITSLAGTGSTPWAREVPEAALVSCQLPPARPAGSALGIGREGESEWPHASSFSSDRNCQGSSRPWGCQGPCSALSVSICRMGGSPRRPLISTQWLWPVCLCRHVDLLGALPESHTGPGLLQKAKGERDLCTQFGGWPPAILRRRWGHRTSRHCLERGQALRPQLFLPWLSGCVSVRILLRLQGARCF